MCLLRCGMISPLRLRHQPPAIADDQPDRGKPDLDMEMEAAALGAFVGLTERRERARQRNAKSAPATHHEPQLIRLAQQGEPRSEEHTSNSSHSQISYAVFCLKKKK